MFVITDKVYRKYVRKKHHPWNRLGGKCIYG
jgi:hypothetical protein